jgi:hypothetical protein
MNKLLSLDEQCSMQEGTDLRAWHGTDAKVRHPDGDKQEIEQKPSKWTNRNEWCFLHVLKQVSFYQAIRADAISLSFLGISHAFISVTLHSMIRLRKLHKCVDACSSWMLNLNARKLFVIFFHMFIKATRIAKCLVTVFTLQCWRIHVVIFMLLQVVTILKCLVAYTAWKLH